MTIPSPAELKKKADEKKARQAELTEALMKATDQMPPTKQASKSRESSKTDGFSKSPLSRKVSRRDGSKSKKTPNSKSSGDNIKTETPESKKPFVRPDHLTQRPLQNNEALQSLRKELEKPARGQFKRAYKTNSRNSGKAIMQNKEKD